jgi:hypothetical protein
MRNGPLFGRPESSVFLRVVEVLVFCAATGVAAVSGLRGAGVPGQRWERRAVLPASARSVIDVFVRGVLDVAVEAFDDAPHPVTGLPICATVREVLAVLQPVRQASP